MKWFLGGISALLLLNIFAQQQTINDLRAELRKANAALSSATVAPTSSPTPTASATVTASTSPTASTTPTSSPSAKTTRAVPKINWGGDATTCNKWDKQSDWWKLTHAYLSDPVKYASNKVWFLYSQSYVDTFAFCFDRTFVIKVNEIASAVN